MLSASICLGIIANEICHSNLQITYICDNQDLIRNCEDRLSYNKPFTNTTLRPEFDLVEEIYQTNKKHQIRASFHLEKGHQDDNIEGSIDEISTEAILNINADQMAKDFNNEKGRIKLDPDEELVPSNSAALIIQGALVSSNYDNRLIEAYTEMRYMKYLQRQFHWSIETLESIAWKSFQNAIKRVDREVLTTKISNRILAVNYVQKRRKHRTLAKCNHCNKIETVSHLYHCDKASRKRWRLSYITQLRKKLKEIKTDESLIDAIATILTEYLDSGYVTREKYRQRFHKAIDSQKKIGFEHFFLGKISQQWLDLHLPHLPSDPSLSEQYTWGCHIIEITLQNMIELWGIRNKEVHGNDDKEIEEIKKRRVVEELQQYFSLQPKCLPCDRSLFPEDTNNFIKNNNSKTLSDWILSNKGWIVASIKRLKDGDLGSYPIMNWIGTAETNDNEKLKKVRENRRKQILREQEREENRKAERKRKGQGKTLKLNSKPTDIPITHHYKIIQKTKQKAKHTIKKKLENNSRKKERR